MNIRPCTTCTVYVKVVHVVRAYAVGYSPYTIKTKLLRFPLCSQLTPAFVPGSGSSRSHDIVTLLPTTTSTAELWLFRMSENNVHAEVKNHSDLFSKSDQVRGWIGCILTTNMDNKTLQNCARAVEALDCVLLVGMSGN